jgi:hypothetical protein
MNIQTIYTKDDFERIKNVSNLQIEAIINKVDIDGNKLIEYSEFLAHSLTKHHLTESNVKAFFYSIISEPHKQEEKCTHHQPNNNQDDDVITAESL